MNLQTFTSKSFSVLPLWIFVLFISVACTKDTVQNETPSSLNGQDSDDNAISLEGDLQVSDFIWEGLNLFYYWQEEVPNLADSKSEDEKAYAKFISENAEPIAFFESLKHEDDRFSWIQDDYEELENTLQGIYATNGVEFGLSLVCSGCEEVVGYVEYILEGSDAATKNIKRGDYFTGVNGTTLTVNNYRSLLFGEELTYTLNLASVQDGALVNNGINVELTKEENFETNPIQTLKTIETASGKLGYLMYNQFVGDKSPELNQAIGTLKNQGINDLIVDLRYNGGGSVRNCIEFASMITGQFTGEIFSKEQWNSKLTTYIESEFGSESLKDRFVDKLAENEEAINSLKLDRVAIITTSDSASASELLINSLSPYINVIHVGEKTVGKNVGSITLYDYIDNDNEVKNPDHKYAMQPIVLKMANKDDFADFTDGLEPDIAVEEDIRNLGILGDPNEPLLAAAINALSGTAKLKVSQPLHPRNLILKDPLLNPMEDMYIDKLFPYQGKR